jgi:Cd2+/Zn2+-exporting ATPase
MEVKVTCDAGNTTLDRLIKMVEMAKENKSYAQEFTHRFEQYFVPATLVFIGLLLLVFFFVDEPFSKSFYRAMTVMVVASPCALVISTPSAVLCGIARAARMGVLIKGGRPLVDLGELDTMVFDKTGTLTRGKPIVTDFLLIDEVPENDLISVIVGLEEKSNHPLASAIAAHFRERYPALQVPVVHDFRSVTGCGIRGKIGDEHWAIGNTELFIGLTGQTLSDGVLDTMNALERKGKSTVLVGNGDGFKALIAIMDQPRIENIDTLRKLRNIGFEQIIMLSGDRKFVVEAVGKNLGMDESYGELLPEEKKTYVEKMVNNDRKVAMVGDGVNDAPAMTKSTVSIAMGAAGNDVALDTADIALMTERLDQLIPSVLLSRRTRAVIRQNIFISLAVILTMIPLALMGIATIGPAVAIHEGSTIAVVLNALRILK